MDPRENEESQINWIEVFSVLWFSRKFITAITGIVTAGAVIVSLLLPEYYKSAAILLPETEKSKLSALGGLSDLAALAGVNVGDATLAKLYPTILKSESVLKNVIYTEYQTKKFEKPVDLIEFWQIEEATPQRDFEAALKALRDDLEVSLDNKTDVVVVSLETREPQLSADIVNKVLEQLDEFIRTMRTTNASDQRRWIEERLGQVKADLEKSENRLKEFREKNRRVGDSPQLLLDQGRFLREVEINSTLYTELKKQFEIAKIEEIKNVPVVSVMDHPRAPGRRERPKRTVIVISSFFLGLAFASAFVVTRKWVDQSEKVRSFLLAIGVQKAASA